MSLGLNILFNRDKEFIILYSCINSKPSYQCFIDTLYGALGAVIGTIVAELVVALSQTYMVRKDLDIRQYFINGCPF